MTTPGALADVIASGAALGAEVRGIDLRAMNGSVFETIHRAWLEHQVLLFRDQQMSDADLIAWLKQASASAAQCGK